MSKIKVHMMGGDGQAWALDTDLAMVRRALDGMVQFSDLASADVVHSVWWEPLLNLSPEQLRGKKVICHFAGEPFRYLTLPTFRLVRERVSLWIAQSSQAAEQCRVLRLNTATVPYVVDHEVFRPLTPHPLPLSPGGSGVRGEGNSQRRELRSKYGLPDDVYLLGTFHRDTAGGDLSIPKLVKGPDVLLEIVRRVLATGRRLHVVLAGPRRHWLRKQFSKAGIPWSFVGNLTSADDYPSNILPAETINELYNALDLYTITSRSEGGPRSILEAAACGCPVFSSAVGLAMDVLSPKAIYQTVEEAVQIVCADMDSHTLKNLTEEHRQKILKDYTIDSSRAKWLHVYRDLENTPRMHIAENTSNGQAMARQTKTLWSRIFPRSNSFEVSLFHKFFKPPYGGGNQFMMALKAGLQQFGVKVRENSFANSVKACVINSVHFDVDTFERASAGRRLSILHRIDGPIHLIRGFDREKDELCFRLNKRFAAATVIQSNWTLSKILEMGYEPVLPVIIRNAVNPAIFHAHGRASFDPNRKIRIIGSAWSNGATKGGAIYKWIGAHLDRDRYEFTFVGRSSEPLPNIRVVPPVPSEQLADLLRQHDVYITASKNDPCSNALIEALACGLPALYMNSGGHPEIVGHAGLPFHGVDDVLSQLDRLVANYATYQNLIAVPSLSEVTGTYLALLKSIAA